MRKPIEVKLDTPKDIETEIWNVQQTQTYTRTKAEYDRLRKILREVEGEENLIAYILLAAFIGFEKENLN